MSRTHVGREEFRLQVADAVGEGGDILEAVGRDWDGSAEHRLPTDPSTIGREHREESSDDQATPDVEAEPSPAAEVGP